MTGFLWSNDEEAFFGDGPKDTPKKAGKSTKPGPGQSLDAPYSVSELNESLKRIIDKSFVRFGLQRDKQSNSIQCRHIYLTLKDAGVPDRRRHLEIPLERIDVDLSEGMAVIVPR